VGFVVTLGVATNPATLYGFGTWSAIEGKVVVGLASGDSDFGTLNAAVGSKTTTLTEANLPAHAHSIAGQTITSSYGGAHTHAYRDRYYAEKASSVTAATNKESMPTNYNGKIGSADTDSDNTTFLYLDSTTGTSATHTHTTTIPDTTTGSIGSATPISNIQPTIVKYVWERTA
jgi:microcystin-dependent protein